jgi:hypothetical protein
MSTGNTAARRAWKKDYEARRAALASIYRALYEQHEQRIFFSGQRIVLMRANGSDIKSANEVPAAVRIENACGLELHHASVVGTADLLRTIEELLSRTYARQRYT